MNVLQFFWVLLTIHSFPSQINCFQNHVVHQGWPAKWHLCGEGPGAGPVLWPCAPVCEGDLELLEHSQERAKNDKGT